MKKKLLYTLLCTTIIATNPALSADETTNPHGTPKPKSAIPSRLMATPSTLGTPTKGYEDDREEQKRKIRDAKVSTPNLKDQQLKKLTEAGFSAQHAEKYVDPLLQKARVERDAQLKEDLHQVDLDIDQKVLARALEKEQKKRKDDSEQVAQLVAQIKLQSSQEVGSLQQKVQLLQQQVLLLQQQEKALTTKYEEDKLALEENARTQDMVFSVYQTQLSELTLDYKKGMEEKSKLKDEVRQLIAQLEKEKQAKDTAVEARNERQSALEQLVVTTPKILSSVSPSKVHTPNNSSDQGDTSGASGVHVPNQIGDQGDTSEASGGLQPSSSVAVVDQSASAGGTEKKASEELNFDGAL